MTLQKPDSLEQPVSTVDTRTDEPPLYSVLLINDDFTPKAFVVDLLVHLFHKSAEEATALMWRVHRGDRGVAGIYPLEIAESKAATGMALAEENGYPLRLEIEADA